MTARRTMRFVVGGRRRFATLAEAVGYAATLRPVVASIEEIKPRPAKGPRITRGFPGLTTKRMAGLYVTGAVSVLAERWTNRYSGKACEEGWGIFSRGGEFGPFEIERDDEMGVFEFDDDALAHVVREAERGSQWHYEALVVHALSEVLK